MAVKRKYDEGCAVAHALDLIGERWALLIVRELLLGPKRFTDLRAGVPGASPDVLSQRLRELRVAGVLRRRKLALPAGSWVYELTEWGHDLEPIVVQLGRWASRSPGLRPEAGLSADSFVLSFKALFDPEAAKGMRGTLGLSLGEDRFRLGLANRRLTVARGELDRPDATLQTDLHTLAALRQKDRRLADAIREGDATVTGDAGFVERFLDLFPMPDPVAL